MRTRDALSNRPARLFRASAPPRPVALTAHEMVVRGPQVFQCRLCLAVARTQASLGKLLGTSCEPSAQERLKARADAGLQKAPPMRSQAVQTALLAADVGQPEADTEAGAKARAGPEASAPADEEIVELLGHQVLVTRGAMVCTLCGSYQVSSGKVANCKLQADCLGPAKDKATRYKHTSAISAVRTGRHPKTGKTLSPVEL